VEPNSLLFLFVASAVMAAPSDGADTALMNAYLKQSGMDKQLRTIEKRTLSKEARKTLGYVGIVIKSAKDQRVTIRWSF
jgi:hypothetical protein